MVELTNENSLLQKIEELATNGKIQSTVGLTAQDAKTKIQKLIPTIRQRINAVRFYLNLMRNMNYAPYLGGQPSLSEKPLIDFSDSDLQVQINLLNSNPFPLVVFVVLNGFCSNLVSLEDCVAKVINIIYDLLQNDRFGYKIRQELDNKRPNGTLTAHLHTFYAIGKDGKPDKIGSAFNIAKEIRNQLVHDDIAEVVFFPTLSLLGLPDLDLYFNNLFFPENTPPKHNDTEMIAFCQNAYDETVNFVDECYKLIHADLQRCGVLPI